MSLLQLLFEASENNDEIKLLLLDNDGILNSSIRNPDATQCTTGKYTTLIIYYNNNNNHNSENNNNNNNNHNSKNNWEKV